MQVPLNSPITMLAQFGVSYGGLTTVGFTLKNEDGTTTYPGHGRSLTGVRDVGNGDYAILYTFPALWTGYIEWDTGGITPVFAREAVDVVPVGTPGIGVIANAISSDIRSVGDDNVPQDIRKLRQKVLDYFNTLGQPVIYKHKWTDDDVAAGMAQFCPYCFNKVWKQPKQTDPYCFGTGFLGGFAPGVVVFVTLGDVTKDTFTLTEQGVLTRSSNPTSSAPWKPAFADEDLLITGTFDPNKWDIVGLSQRFICREVNGINPRGSRPSLDTTLYQVSQQFRVDELQPEHPLWNVPVIFDTSNLPPFPLVPPGGDPSDYGGLNTSVTSILVTMPVDNEAGKVTVTFPPES